MDRRVLARFVHILGDYIVFFAEILVIVATTIMIAITAYAVFNDIIDLGRSLATEEMQILVNDVFLIIIFAEIVRSVLAAHRRPELYVVGIAEVGFVVAVREVLVAVITKTTMDLLLASLSALAMAAVLWLVYSKIVKMS